MGGYSTATGKLLAVRQSFLQLARPQSFPLPQTDLCDFLVAALVIRPEGLGHILEPGRDCPSVR